MIILGITVLSIVLFAGIPPSVAGMKQKIRLGLDLRGGTQLVLQVQVDDALKATTDQTIEALRAQMEKDSITVRQFTRPANDTLEARGVDPAKDSEFRNMVEGSLYRLRDRLQPGRGSKHLHAQDEDARR